MSDLLKALAEQEKAMEALGQPAMSPQAYLYSSVTGKSGSPERTSLHGHSPTKSEAARSPSRAGQSTIILSQSVKPLESPSKSGNVNAIEGGVITEVDAHPATGYPAADDAYMNNLPQEIYSPKVFLAKHVTETLELCLRVLTKNSELRGGRLSSADQAIIDQIANFSHGFDVARTSVEDRGSSQAVLDSKAVSAPVRSIGDPSSDSVEAGLCEARYD